MQPLLQWKTLHNAYCECVRSLSYPACNEHLSYYHFLPAPALQYFSTFAHKRHDFRKTNLLNTKHVFWFPLKHSSSTFLSLRRNEWDAIKNAHSGGRGFSCGQTDGHDDAISYFRNFTNKPKNDLHYENFDQYRSSAYYCNIYLAYCSDVTLLGNVVYVLDCTRGTSV